MHRLVINALAALAVLATLLVAPSQPASARDVDSLRSQIAKLRTQADAATARLEKNTAAYEAGRRKLASTQRRLLSAADSEQRAQQDVDAIHRRLVTFAVNAYTSPTGDEFGMLLDNPLANRGKARSTVDVSVLAKAQSKAARKYQATLDRQHALRRHAKQLERAASAQQRRLAVTQKKLQTESNRITDQLVGKLDRLTMQLVKQDEYGAAYQASRERLARMGDDTTSCEKPAVGGFPNGLIPKALLCPLPEHDEYLRADAARAFWLLDTAYRMSFGSHICVTDSYRPLGEQHSVYQRKPALAAVPGTSRHGLGIAVDLGCGIQTFGSTEFRWMKRNAPKFGWVHPAWAESNPFEPWHWEYEGR